MFALSKLFRTCITFLLILSACSPITPASPTESAATATEAALPESSSTEPPITIEEAYAEAVVRLDRFLALVEQLRTEIDRTQFDLEALGFALGFEAEPLIEFVRNEIAFEQYPGLLRGAQGTLIGQAGNALDQAMLLNTLLADAGYETHITRGSLSPEEADLLLQQMAASRSASPPPGDIAALRALVEQMAALSFEPPAELEEIINRSFAPPPIEELPIYATAQANAETVLASLADAGLMWSAADSQVAEQQAMLRGEAQDYFWVEYRLGPGDDWQTAHPAFGTATVDLTQLLAQEIYQDSIPAALQHRLRFQAWIEQKNGDTRQKLPLFEAWETTAAAVIGQPLTYHNHPDGTVEQLALVDMQSVLDNAKLFLPILNQKPIPNAHAFDLQGNLFEDNTGAEDAFNLKPLAGALEGAAGSLAGALGGKADKEPSSEPVGSLQAHWLVYTLIAPDGSEQEFRRTVWSADSDTLSDVEQSSQRSALATQQTFMLAPGKLNTAFVLEQTLARISSYAPLLRHMLAENSFPGQGAAISSSVLEKINTAWLGHLSLYKAFDWIEQSQAAQRIYRSEPSLVVYSQQFNQGHVTHALDIVNNSQRAFTFESGQPIPAPKDALLAGVWETYVEAQALEAPDSPTISSAAAFLDQSQAEHEAMSVITQETFPELTTTTIPEAVRSAIQHDLASGFVIVVPASQLTKPSGPDAWWRVHAKTGETLGMLSKGIGGNPMGGVVAQPATEYVIKVGAHVILFSISFAHCIGLVQVAAGHVGTAQIVGCLGISIGFAFAKFPTDIVDGVLWILSISGLFL